ncbi:hypothetical protein MASR2M17_04420 [Aminivibrio sp.]
MFSIFPIRISSSDERGKRLSNFWIWQSAYSELYFTETLCRILEEKSLKRLFRIIRTGKDAMGQSETTENRLRGLLIRAVSGAAVVALVLGGFAGGIFDNPRLHYRPPLLAEFYGMVSRRFKVSRGIGFLAALLIIFTAAEGINRSLSC